MYNFLYRLLQPVPPFFRVTGNLALTIAFIAIVILTMPVTIPSILLTSAVFLLCGALLTWFLCQLTIDDDLALIDWIGNDSGEFVPAFIHLTSQKNKQHVLQ